MGCGSSSVATADNDEMGIVCVGLAGAGKSSFLRAMNVGKVTRQVTVGRKLGKGDDDDPEGDTEEGKGKPGAPPSRPGGAKGRSSMFDGGPPVAMESATMRSLKCYSWDLSPKQDQNVKEMRTWSRYSMFCKGLLFVVDSSAAGKPKLRDAQRVLRWLLEDVEDFKSSDVFLVVLCNKQDDQDALSLEEVGEALQVDKLCGGGEDAGGRPYKLMPVVATSGQGVFNAVEYLTRRVVATRNT